MYRNVVLLRLTSVNLILPFGKKKLHTGSTSTALTSMRIAELLSGRYFSLQVHSRYTGEVSRLYKNKLNTMLAVLRL